jgi:hypothetical protein
VQRATHAPGARLPPPGGAAAPAAPPPARRCGPGAPLPARPGASAHPPAGRRRGVPGLVNTGRGQARTGLKGPRRHDFRCGGPEQAPACSPRPFLGEIVVGAQACQATRTAPKTTAGTPTAAPALAPPAPLSPPITPLARCPEAARTLPPSHPCLCKPATAVATPPPGGKKRTCASAAASTFCSSASSVLAASSIVRCASAASVSAASWARFSSWRARLRLCGRGGGELRGGRGAGGACGVGQGSTCACARLCRAVLLDATTAPAHLFLQLPSPLRQLRAARLPLGRCCRARHAWHARAWRRHGRPHSGCPSGHAGAGAGAGGGGGAWVAHGAAWVAAPCAAWVAAPCAAWVASCAAWEAS